MAPLGRPGLSAEQKKDLWARWKAGESLSAIGRALGRHAGSIHGVLASRGGGVVPRPRTRSSRVLTSAEREDISRGLAASRSLRSIACELHRTPSTISREIARNAGRTTYRASTAGQLRGQIVDAVSIADRPPAQNAWNQVPYAAQQRRRSEDEERSDGGSEPELPHPLQGQQDIRDLMFRVATQRGDRLFNTFRRNRRTPEKGTETILGRNAKLAIASRAEHDVVCLAATSSNPEAAPTHVLQWRYIAHCPRVPKSHITMSGPVGITNPAVAPVTPSTK